MDHSNLRIAGVPTPRVGTTIDPWQQPEVRNPDGSRSTVATIGIGEGDLEVVIPTIGPRGERWTPEEATRAYRASGRHLGKFGSIEEANRFAQWLHEAYASGMFRSAVQRALGPR